MASQYLWALEPKDGEEAWQQYGGVAFAMTNADINTIYRWPETERTQELAFSNLDYPSIGNQPKELWAA